LIIFLIIFYSLFINYLQMDFTKVPFGFSDTRGGRPFVPAGGRPPDRRGSRLPEVTGIQIAGRDT